MNKPITPNELRKHFPHASPSTLARNPAAGGLAPDAQRKQNPGHDLAPAVPREVAYAPRRLVRVTSFRLYLLDERNLWDKHFVDSLVTSGIITDDSPAWAKIEVNQVLVTDEKDERTEIEISDLPLTDPLGR
jgi:hypothetical protein